MDNTTVLLSQPQIFCVLTFIKTQAYRIEIGPSGQPYNFDYLKKKKKKPSPLKKKKMGGRDTHKTHAFKYFGSFQML